MLKRLNFYTYEYSDTQCRYEYIFLTYFCQITEHAEYMTNLSGQLNWGPRSYFWGALLS